MSERLVWDSMSIRHFKTKSSRLAQSLSFITLISLAFFCRRIFFLEVSRSTCWFTCCHGERSPSMSSTRCFHTINEGPMRPSRPPNGGIYSFQSKMFNNLIGISGVCELMPFHSVSHATFWGGYVLFWATLFTMTSPSPNRTNEIIQRIRLHVSTAEFWFHALYESHLRPEIAQCLEWGTKTGSRWNPIQPGTVKGQLTSPSFTHLSSFWKHQIMMSSRKNPVQNKVRGTDIM